MRPFHVTLYRGTSQPHTFVPAAHDADHAREIVQLDRGDEPGDRWEVEPADVAITFTPAPAGAYRRYN